jgi:competence protein ComEA
VTKQLTIAAVAGAFIATISGFLFVLLYERQGAPTIVIEDAPAKTEIVISIAGAVNAPGVYHLPSDARLNDAIVAAGGFAPDADLSGINLALRLDDEQSIEIPRQRRSAEGSPVATIGSSGSSTAADSAHININTADAVLLDTLPGIGPAIAGRIVEYRETHGPFTRIEELARVDGISAAMVDEMRDKITVE